MSTLTAAPISSHLRLLAATQGTALDKLSGAPLVAISSVMFSNVDPAVRDPQHRYEALRFHASLAASAAYARAGVPQIVMFDPRSRPEVPGAFARYGAVVVPTPRPGLATPYLDAAQLVQMYAGPRAAVLKAEADKLLDSASLELILAELRSGADVLVGDRTAQSMATMTPIQHRTEALIDTLVAEAFELPHGTSCGVQAYSPQGLKFFLQYERMIPTLGNNWKYLLYTPAVAQREGFRVGTVPANIQYDRAMVDAEKNMPSLTLKRLEQLLVMLEGAMEIFAVLHGHTGKHVPASAARRAEAEAALSLLRKLATQSV